jgi:hypothetical protein
MGGAAPQSALQLYDADRYDGGMDFLFSIIAYILEPLAVWWMRDKPHGRSRRDRNSRN